MSLVGFVVAAFAFAGVALAFRSHQRTSLLVGMVGLVVVVVSAIAMDPAQSALIGGAGLVTSAYLRLFLVLGSLVGLGLAIISVAAGTRRDAPAVTLATLGAAALTLALTDAPGAVIVATTGGLFGVLVTLAPSGGRAGATVGIREARAVVVAGTMAIAGTAWIGGDLGQIPAQPVVVGLAYLAVGLAVAIRFGAIPFHLWAAHLADAVPETALPILTVIGPASLAVVALAWTNASVAPLSLDVEAMRAIVLAVAVASIVLAGLAALVQDDIEHVVGYSIVGDAGVVLLALAALDPAASGPAQTWILAFLVTRSAFAAWAAGIRLAFLTGRIGELGGWAIRSPILGIAFALVAVASVGFPGLAAFDARTQLVGLALDGPLALIVLLGTLSPLFYYGRLLVVGLSRSDRAVPPTASWRPRIVRPDLTAPQTWLRTSWSDNRAFSAALVAAMLGLLALTTAAGAFGGPATAAAGLPPRVGAVGPSVATYSFGASTQRSISRSYSNSSSGRNQSASSVAAASGLSEAWTMFCAVSRAKSPRMVPSAASCGRVAPLIARTTAIAFGPSNARATSGAETMNPTNPAKNGFSRWVA